MDWRKQLGKDNRGSRPRCVLIVDGNEEEVANRLTRLVNLPDVVVCPDDEWKPCGKWDVAEAQLDKANNLVSCSETRQQLRDWWLAANGRATTPNWDIASTCTIKGRPGLLLVEAKAHVKELWPKSDKCSSTNPENRAQIGRAIAKANDAFQSATEEKWGLSRDHHYQLSNRFAWSWKLASLGIPVVLLYLGFLNAQDMTGKELFRSYAEWEKALNDYGEGVIDNTCWEKWLKFDGGSLRPLIQVYDQPFEP